MKKARKLQVNEMPVAGMVHSTVADILANARKPQLKIRVKRRRFHGARMLTFSLPPMAEGQELGIRFQAGVYITALKATAACRLESAALGDRVVLLNDMPVEEKPPGELQQLIAAMAPHGFSLTVLRPSANLTPSLSFRSNPSTSLPTPTTVSSAASSERGHSVPPPINGNLGSPNGNNNGNLGELNPKTIFDKVHDKLFGRPEKKPMAAVKTVAQASIPQNPASSDNLK